MELPHPVAQLVVASPQPDQFAQLPVNSSDTGGGAGRFCAAKRAMPKGINRVRLRPFKFLLSKTPRPQRIQERNLETLSN